MLCSAKWNEMQIVWQFSNPKDIFMYTSRPLISLPKTHMSPSLFNASNVLGLANFFELSYSTNKNLLTEFSQLAGLDNLNISSITTQFVTSTSTYSRFISTVAKSLNQY